MPKAKKIILPGITLLVSAFISFLFVLGLGAGFLGTHYYHKKVPENSRMKYVFLNLGKRKLHLHHWIMATLFFILIWALGLLHVFPKFCIGGIFGIIFHDIFTDKDWYRVFVKK